MEGREHVIALLEKVSRSLMGPDPAHGWPHVERVRRIAWDIVRAEGLGVDEFILEAAVLLHDAGRSLEGEEHHAVKSARLAETLLGMAGVPEEEVKRIVHAILAHSYSLGVKPESVEAMVLSDADKLDALGAVGIARVFHTGCQMGRGFEDSLGHFKEKILRLPSLMHFDYSRRLAEERARIIYAFLEAMESELGKAMG